MRFDRGQQLGVESSGYGTLAGGKYGRAIFDRRARNLRRHGDGFRGDLVGQNGARATVKIVFLRGRTRDEEGRETRDQQAGEQCANSQGVYCLFSIQFGLA